MARAGRLQRTESWREVSLVLCDDDEIRQVNRKHLGRQETTDVISFSYTPIPGEGAGRTGEIVVNVQCAAEVARAAGRNWDASKELALYIAHGCDHLMGQEDSTGIERNRMRRRELRWIAEATDMGLTGDLIR